MKLFLVFWTIFALVIIFQQDTVNFYLCQLNSEHYLKVSAEWVPRTSDQMYKDQAECFKQLELTKEEQEKVKKEDFPDEPKFRCYLRCILMGGQIWDDEKGYNPERAYAELLNIHMTADVENLRKCNTQNLHHSDSCTRAFRVVKCFANNNYITSIKPKS